MPRIPDKKRLEIITLNQAGNSQRQIANQLKVSQNAVHALLKKFKATGNHLDRFRCGRPSKITIREIRNLIRLSMNDPFLTARDLHSQWLTSTHVSLTTIRRILTKYGLYARIAARKPLLTMMHKRKRLQWCKDYKSWTASEWEKVIFSDECRIQLHQSKPSLVRRPRGCRYNEKYTQKTVCHREKSIVIWGAIKSNGERSLVLCNGNINATKYQSILQQGLFTIYNNQEIFVHDNAPCHTARSTVDFLEKYGVCTMNDWPAMSPDLNIIENMWAKLKRQLAQERINTLGNLWPSVQRLFNEIPSEFIKKLFDSIPLRINYVLRNKGQCTRF
jgi:transposase/arsenate reductase-like glutaredoxin family protein